MVPGSNRTIWIALAVGLGIGLAIGAAFGRFLLPTPEPRSQPDVEIRAEGWRFTRPLLECEIGGSGPQRRELRFFKDSLQEVVSALEEGGQVREVSVYFRDLDNGPWIGLDSDREFTPASLNKVPLIIACFKEAEVVPGFLDLRILFPGLPDPQLGAYHYAPSISLEAGREYAVMELVERTAMFSDNGAAWLLLKVLDTAILESVYGDLGLETTQGAFGPVADLSTETLGRFFRILYNATYLTREHSEQVLQAFSRSVFEKGLVEGIPAGTVVAHKFGEKTTEEGGVRLVQLHDAGIVYHPRHTYLLCVMTLGTDYGAQERAIAAVSRFVWQEVSRQTSTQGQRDIRGDGAAPDGGSSP